MGRIAIENRRTAIGTKRAADLFADAPIAKKSMLEPSVKKQLPPACQEKKETALLLDAEQMAEMKAAVYARCEKKRKMYSWSKCPKCILDPLIERILRWTGVGPKDTFLDIGSGVGNVVETVATRVGCRTIGVEVMKPNHEVAVAAAPMFEEARAAEGLLAPRVEYINADIRKVWRRLREEATVVWFANKLMPFEIDVWTIGAIEELRPGTRIVMMKPMIPVDDHDRLKYFHCDEMEWGAGDVEWTREPGKLYMYTRTDHVGDDMLLDESTMDSTLGALSTQCSQASDSD